MKTMTEPKFLKTLAPHIEKFNTSAGAKPFQTEKSIGLALSKFFVLQAMEVKDADAYVRLLSISLMGAILRDGITMGLAHALPALTREKVLTPQALEEFAKLLTDVRSTITRAMRGAKRTRKVAAKKAKPKAAPKPAQVPARVAVKTRGRPKVK